MTFVGTTLIVGSIISTTSGNHVYVVWWSIKSGDWEVILKASDDGEVIW